MSKAYFFMTLFLTMTAAAQSNRAIQRLVFEVSKVNKAGFSHGSHDDESDRDKGRSSKDNDRSSKDNDRSQKDNASGREPVATTSLYWISTSGEKKVTFQTTGSSRIVILEHSASEDMQDVTVQNTKATEVTLSTIGKFGSIDLEICREPAPKGGASDGNISKIVCTLTGS